MGGGYGYNQPQQQPYSGDQGNQMSGAREYKSGRGPLMGKFSGGGWKR